MKKSLILIFSVLLIIAFTALCFGFDKTKSTVTANSVNPLANETNKTNEPNKTKTTNKSKSLIVYYSLSGNTRAVAGYLQALVDADIAEIKTVRPYPDDFHAVVEQAREERRTGYLPPIQPILSNIQDYDTIYIGYPVWGNTIPQPMAMFLSQNNLAGKTLIPFCTHDGYGTGRSFQVISDYCPNAKILDGFDMLGANARSAETLLSEWLRKIGVSLSNDSDSAKINKSATPITITIGKTVLSGTLNDSPTAREFMSRLPQTISMGAYGGREYYGSIANRIDTKEEGRLRFDDGDITYCPQNNTVAIFFAQTDRPNLTMRVIPIGKVTTDLSVFQNMERSIQVTFSLSR